jgi:hypothetical protein
MNNEKIDKNDVEHIKKFVTLFKHRDETYSSITGELFGFIKDNIIASFEDIIQLPTGRITWLDLQLDLEDNGALILSFYLDYNYNEANKFVLNNFGYDELDELDESRTRLIRFGIPLHFVFSTKEEFTTFVLDITESSKEDMNITIDKSPPFDMSKLTPDQLKQLQLFNMQGTTH